MKKHQFVKENKELLEKMYRNNIDPLLSLRRLEAFELFQNIQEKTFNESKMESYETLAKSLFGKNGSAKTMRNWIYDMKKEVD